MNFLDNLLGKPKSQFERDCIKNFKEIIQTTKAFFDYYTDVIFEIASNIHSESTNKQIDKEYLKQYRKYLNDKIRLFQNINDTALQSDAYLLSNFLNGLDESFLYKYLRTDKLEYVENESFSKEIAYIITFFEKRIKNEVDAEGPQQQKETAFLESKF